MNLSESAEGPTIHHGPGLAHASWNHASLAGTQNCPVGGQNSHILIRNLKWKVSSSILFNLIAIISHFNDSRFVQNSCSYCIL